MRGKEGRRKRALRSKTAIESARTASSQGTDQDRCKARGCRAEGGEEEQGLGIQVQLLLRPGFVTARNPSADVRSDKRWRKKKRVLRLINSSRLWPIILYCMYLLSDTRAATISCCCLVCAHNIRAVTARAGSYRYPYGGFETAYYSVSGGYLRPIV